MIVLYDERCLEFSVPGHPESPERLQKAHAYLKERAGYRFVPPPPASDEDLLRVHTRSHLDRVHRLEFSDPDSPRYPDILEYARLSAGAAIEASRSNGFSLTRPPGHHAGPARVAGFCFLNNVAIAVKSREVRTLILDIDGHHGDGTQEIFLGDQQVIYISLHSSPNYPGTGLRSEGNCHNYPLPLHCGEARYLETLDRALGEVHPSAVEQVAISAGFDTFERDPLAPLGLNAHSYREIGKRVAELRIPAFAVLEGGYDADSLGENIHQFLLGLSS